MRPTVPKGNYFGLSIKVGTIATKTSQPHQAGSFNTRLRSLDLDQSRH